MRTKQWNVKIYLTEEGDETHARAVLNPDESSSVHGNGVARRNPADRDVPEIGDELAVSRALEDLAIRLRKIAADDITQLTDPPQPHRML